MPSFCLLSRPRRLYAPHVSNLSWGRLDWANVWHLYKGTVEKEIVIVDAEIRTEQEGGARRKGQKQKTDPSETVRHLRTRKPLAFCRVYANPPPPLDRADKCHAVLVS